jgi:hypothetical protein
MPPDNEELHKTNKELDEIRTETPKEARANQRRNC